MTEQDRVKWDTRYENELGNPDPAEIVKNHWHQATGKSALDIACGNGRNSLFLAQRGFRVDAVDISKIATDHLQGRHPGIQVICRDLDTWHIPFNQYDLIIDIRFLDRRLFPMIRKGLRPGGVLIVESFVGNAGDSYCLLPNELLEAFQSFRIVYYEEKALDHSEKFNRVAALVAVKP